jgi:branched-chain amino acid aminotransferase
MAFEVTRTVGHRPLRLRQHLQRLAHSLAALRIDAGMSLDQFEDATHETLARNLPSEEADVDWKIIHNVSRGPSAMFVEAFEPAERRATVVISCYPLTSMLAAMAGAYRDGIDLVVPALRALPGDWYDASIKTRSRAHYQMANLQAGEIHKGAVAVMVEPSGLVAETTSGNVFAVLAGQLCTPPTRSILPGVTRQMVLELARECGIEAAERDFHRDCVLGAQEVFITSTSIGIVHVRSWDGQAIGEGRLGPITARLRAALDQSLGLCIAEQAARYASRRRAGA